MTKKEYNDLKFKITIRENHYKFNIIIIAIFIVFCLITITFLISLSLEGLRSVFGAIMIGWLYYFIGIDPAVNPYNNKHKTLDKLYKNGTSHEEAEKILKLEYETPND